MSDSSISQQLSTVESQLAESQAKLAHALSKLAEADSKIELVEAKLERKTKDCDDLRDRLQDEIKKKHRLRNNMLDVSNIKSLCLSLYILMQVL